MSKTLYQKYRPFTFKEVIGQDFIKKILIGSIKSNQIQGTYLFSGPRGTGKTSIAKIFARAINCDSTDLPLEDDCSYCNYFKENKSYDDIYELDAASNNGVDDIRQIIESVQYPPIKLKRKVYIIDEVHMLSKGAFNALLKTLEEPNSNCIFILATTEPNRVPATILSRCQRFDFSRIEPSILKEHLKNILNKEEIKYDEEIFEPIINLSDGCVRDSLSLVQKLIIGTNHISLKTLEDSLGIPTEEVYNKILDYILNFKVNDLLKYWSEIYYKGINIENFIVDFQYYLKNILINNKYKQADKKDILKVIYKFNDLEQRAVYTKNLNSLIEITFMELCSNSIAVEKEVNINNKEIISNNIVRDNINNNKEIISNNIVRDNINNNKEIISNNIVRDNINNNKEITSNNLVRDNINNNKEITSNNLVRDNINNNKEITSNSLVKDSVNNVEVKNNKYQDLVINNNVEDVSDDNQLSYDDLNEVNLVEVLNNASKENRINLTKDFSKVGDKLTLENKKGLARFFIDGSIKAVTNEEAIIVINETFVSPFLKRKEELLSLININNIHIMDDSSWNSLKKEYLNFVNNKNKVVKPIENKEKKDEIVNVLESKLKTKVIIEEK